MRKLFIVVTLLAFVVASAVVFARDPGQEKQDVKHIKCCFQDGQCLETKRDNCDLKKGIVVEDCKECPGVWGKDKQK
jgi:hypothetical protein